MFDLKLYHKYLITNFIGRNIQYYETLLSTNTKALELASTNVKDGTVTITDNQTLGRGRKSNKWFSVPGNSLTFSLILYPNILINQINYYSIIAGLAVSDCLNKLQINSNLKWPNDILINNKKVGGILCESKLSGDTVKSLIIGIGVNINEKINDFPEHLQLNSTSLFVESKKKYELELLLANILNNIEQRLNKINDFKTQISEWEKNCVHLNKAVSFKYDNKIINGIFKGLTDKGEAIILIGKEENYYNSGEIV